MIVVFEQYCIFCVRVEHFGMANIKFIASQAKTINLYKNTRSKLLKCCVKDLYIFIEGPDDDSHEIKTCHPSPINSILMIVVFD